MTYEERFVHELVVRYQDRWKVLSHLARMRDAVLEERRCLCLHYFSEHGSSLACECCACARFSLIPEEKKQPLLNFISRCSGIVLQDVRPLESPDPPPQRERVRPFRKRSRVVPDPDPLRVLFCDDQEIVDRAFERDETVH